MKQVWLLSPAKVLNFHRKIHKFSSEFPELWKTRGKPNVGEYTYSVRSSIAGKR